ncbi:hypothetical protein GPECTOR_2g1538 [Gonium pectorale]|uniref:Hedgehog protein Hint domain-containing protein n=1 Tax=Gonium pectorale TaxID=33097 RepID=A0A150H1E5_GONPE|nr:hypothetical protein GPECTOR_2g1538 [Gonium pectorale]|eukprot:KXZ55986.1 hypothetical protein GPECTOR_2g1538 [Gonium pectorale]
MPITTASEGCNLIRNGINQFLTTSAGVDPALGTTSHLVAMTVLSQTGCDGSSSSSSSGDGPTPAASGVSGRVRDDRGTYYVVQCTASSCAVSYDVHATLAAAGAMLDGSDDASITGTAQRRLQQANWGSCMRVVTLFNGKQCCWKCGNNYDLDGKCGCKSSPGKDNGEQCFPADATVLGRASPVRMDELQYGDLVRSRDRATGAEVHRPVYVFGHRDADRTEPFLHLTAATAGGAAVRVERSLVLTAHHFLPVCVGSSSSSSREDELLLARRCALDGVQVCQQFMSAHARCLTSGVGA